MREYDDDDNIRLYAPVLQRVIILAAVVIAVPVMMWTITTFIRSYVAQPKAPTFQHLALTEASPSPPPASPLAASPPPPQTAQPPAQSAQQAISAPPLADAGTSAGAIGRAAVSDTGVPTPPSPPPVPAMAGAAVVNSAPSAAPAPQAPMATPDASGLPTVAQPPGMVGRLATNGSGTPAGAPTDRGTDRGAAWPAPSTDSPPGAGVQEPPVATTETASTEALPPSQPIKGRIPLPRRRPAALALAATGDMAPPVAATEMAISETASTDALPPPQPIKGRIPLPRRRPAVLALAATGSIVPSAPIGRAVPMPKMRPVAAPPDPQPAATSAPYGYQPGLDGGR